MEPSIGAFDFYKMFFGQGTIAITLLEIMFRTTFIYLYTLVNIRLFHARGTAQLTSFELIIVIALGTAVGDPMVYDSIPLINAMAAITTVVLITRLLSVITEQSDFVEILIEGKPILLIKNGVLIKGGLKKAELSIEELNSRLRQKGIKNIGQVEYAFFETSGQLSVIESQNPISGNSTLNHFE
jgi:uncharacterized membrane protein YcaP (DUF421 family)